MQRVCGGNGLARAVAISEHLWKAGEMLVPLFWVTALSQTSEGRGWAPPRNLHRVKWEEAKGFNKLRSASIDEMGPVGGSSRVHSVWIYILESQAYKVLGRTDYMICMERASCQKKKKKMC